MRRNAISIVLALPVASALSLANFQQITSSLISTACITKYDSQIPSCTENDFNNGCSIACIAGLNSVAGLVSDACGDVDVNPNTLLGFVLSGDIIEALCPKTSTTTSKTTPTEANSVTIPTNSQGVTGGLGLKTTTTSPSVSKTTSVLTTQSTASISSTSKMASSKTKSSTTQTSTTAATTADTTSSTTAAVVVTTSSTSSKTSKTTSTTSAKSTSTNGGVAGDDGTGSPFDVPGDESHSSASLVEIRSIVTMAAVIFWAGIWLRR